MALFELSKTSEREWHAAFRRTQAMGTVPLLFALMAILSMPGRSGPVIWGSLGVAMGLHLVLWGVYNLHLANMPAGPAAVPSSKAAPVLIFWIFHLFGWIILVMLWTSLARLEFPSTVLMNIIFYLMLPLIPAKAYWYHLTAQSHEKRAAIVNEALRYALLAGIVLLLALAGTHAVMEAEGEFVEKVPAKLIWIWTAATLIIFTCLILLADHLHAFLKARMPAGDKPAAAGPEPRLPY